MRVVALISGGKDSCFNMMQCVASGHDIVALANLRPLAGEKDELDSYMYQTVGHDAIQHYAEAMDLPLYRESITGGSIQQGVDYVLDPGDEVEDLYRLLARVKVEQNVEAVSVGAILSNYQRVRVENVCSRLGLVSLSYLWRRNQSELLQEMIDSGLKAVIVKVAALGLKPKKHLGMELSQIKPDLENLRKQFGINVCGEGGEYESFTLDCPLFKKKIVLNNFQMIMHSDDPIAPVAYLKLTDLSLEPKLKDEIVQSSSWSTPLAHIADLMTEEIGEIVNSDLTRSAHWSQKLDHKPALIVNKATWGWLTGVSAVLDLASKDVELTTQKIMDEVKNILESQGLTLEDVISISLYVKCMADYAAVNQVYARYFPLNPPTRVCVQVPLADDVLFLLEATLYRKKQVLDSVGHGVNTMHVQSISHWAPANIGPYSQAKQIGDLLFVSGQIGLIPGSMTLPAKSGVVLQCRLALRHINRAIIAMSEKMSIRDVAQAVCYVTDRSYIRVARTLWEAESNDAIVDYVIVSALPRNALVEWQVWAHRYNRKSEYLETGYCMESGTVVSLRRGWAFDGQLSIVSCQAENTAGTDSDELVEILRYSIQQLRRDSGAELKCMLRIFITSEVPLLSWQKAVEELGKDSSLNFSQQAVSVIPVLGLESAKTFISISGLRLEV